MKRIIKILSKEYLLWLIVSFCLGAIVLSFLSVFQKASLGVDPCISKGFIVPVLFGGISVAIIGRYISQKHHLNFRIVFALNV